MAISTRSRSGPGSPTISRAAICSGSVQLNNGSVHTIHYSIIEDGGFAGFGQGVEWCVVGLDRNWAYNPACKAAGP